MSDKPLHKILLILKMFSTKKKSENLNNNDFTNFES